MCFSSYVFGWVDRKWGEEKSGRKTLNSREKIEKKSGGVGVFHLGPPKLFFPNWRENEKGNDSNECYMCIDLFTHLVIIKKKKVLM